MDLIQLIYCSQPFGYNAVMLHGILSDARRRNARDAISGALICRADLYLQLLEGPAPAVEAAFLRIGRDDRHLEVNRLVRRPVASRLFAAWAMRDDPARSWMWSQAEVEAGAAEHASQDEVVQVFTRLAAEVAREAETVPP